MCVGDTDIRIRTEPDTLAWMSMGLYSEVKHNEKQESSGQSSRERFSTGSKGKTLWDLKIALRHRESSKGKIKAQEIASG